MSGSPNSQDLRSFLLGRLSEEEAAAIEQRLVSDETFFREVQMAEEELVDDLALGAISTKDAQRLAEQWPGLRRRVAMRKALLAALEKERLSPSAAPPAGPPPRLPRRLLIPGFTLAAGVLLAVSLLLLKRNPHPGALPAATPARPAEAPQAVASAEAPPIPKPAAGAVVFFPEHVSRGASSQPIRLHAQPSQSVTLELELPEEASPAQLWSVTVANRHGIVLSENGLLALQTGALSFVRAIAGPSVLLPGTYRVSLSLEEAAHPTSAVWELRVTG